MPVAETYSAISGNFHVAFTNGAGQPSIEVTPAYSGVEAGKGFSPSRTCNSEGWVDFERNDRGTAIPDAQFESHSSTQSPSGYVSPSNDLVVTRRLTGCPLSRYFITAI